MPSYKGTKVHGVSLLAALATGVVPGISIVAIQPRVGEVKYARTVKKHTHTHTHVKKLPPTPKYYHTQLAKVNICLLAISLYCMCKLPG